MIIQVSSPGRLPRSCSSVDCVAAGAETGPGNHWHHDATVVAQNQLILRPAMAACRSTAWADLLCIQSVVLSGCRSSSHKSCSYSSVPHWPAGALPGRAARARGVPTPDRYTDTDLGAAEFRVKPGASFTATLCQCSRAGQWLWRLCHPNRRAAPAAPRSGPGYPRATVQRRAGNSDHTQPAGPAYYGKRTGSKFWAAKCCRPALPSCLSRSLEQSTRTQVPVVLVLGL
jgi:hypothetical protein